MPDSTLSEALREAYAYADGDEVIIDTVELYHPAFTEPIRVVADRADFVATLEATAPRDAGAEVTFLAFGFRCEEPRLDDQGRPRFRLEVDNVSREILRWVQAASESIEPVQVIPRRYLADDPSGPQNDPPWRLVATQVQADALVVSCDCVLPTLNPDAAFPAANYTLATHPGLIG